MKTVNINNYSVNDVPKIKLSRKTLQEIFGISNREKWVERLEACGFTADWFCDQLGISLSDYNPRAVTSIPIFQIEEIARLSLLDLFLKQKKGKRGFSKSQFHAFMENGFLLDLIDTFRFDPIKHFQELYYAYQNRNK